MNTVPPATSVLWDRKIMSIERVYTGGTFFMTPAVVEQFVKVVPFQPLTHGINCVLCTLACGNPRFGCTMYIHKEHICMFLGCTTQFLTVTFGLY